MYRRTHLPSPTTKALPIGPDPRAVSPAAATTRVPGTFCCSCVCGSLSERATENAWYAAQLPAGSPEPRNGDRKNASKTTTSTPKRGNLHAGTPSSPLVENLRGDEHCNTLRPGAIARGPHTHAVEDGGIFVEVGRPGGVAVPGESLRVRARCCCCSQAQR